jgi:hypothetical protein
MQVLHEDLPTLNTLDPCAMRARPSMGLLTRRLGMRANEECSSRVVLDTFGWSGIGDGNTRSENLFPAT